MRPPGIPVSRSVEEDIASSIAAVAAAFAAVDLEPWAKAACGGSMRRRREVVGNSMT